MDSIRKIRRLLNKRGVAIILVAGIMVAFLLLFLVVGIDFARMYYVRGELQNAADAAALAGAKQLDGTNSVTQPTARQTAWQFACRNSAAAAKVFLVTGGGSCDSPPAASSLNSGNAANGDIVVGYWDGSTFNASIPSGQIANAVKVVARRTSDSPGGSVGLLFGKLVGWSNMDVVRRAIAARLPRPTSGISLCIDACPNINPSLVLPNLFKFNNQVNGSPYAVSYTEFDTSSSVGTDTCLHPTSSCNVSATCGDANNELVSAYIWQRRIAPASCMLITWANGQATARFDLACAFASTTFDVANKTDTSGRTPAQGPVASWRVIVPLTNTCPSGTTPGQGPYPITGFAEITITSVEPNGSAQGITISNIRCMTCSEYSALGESASLVK